MKKIKNHDSPVLRHISGEDLIAYLDGELSRAAQDGIRSHLERCWNCRSRLHAVQDSIENFLQLRRSISINNLPTSGDALAEFRQRLYQHKNKQVQSSGRPSKLKQWITSWQNIFPNFNLLTTKYGKAVFATVFTGLVLFIILPYLFNQTAVSASELLNKADKYEQLYQPSKEKAARSSMRMKRINLSNNTEKSIGQIETVKDNLSPAVYSLVKADSGESHAVTVSSERQLLEAIPFKGEFSEPLANYFEAQGWYPEVSVAAYRKLIAHSGSEQALVEKSVDEFKVYHFFAPEHSSGITKTLIVLRADNFSPERISIFTVEAGNTIEYRFTRTALELISRSPEFAKLFSSGENTNSTSVPEAVISNKRELPTPEMKEETKTIVGEPTETLPNRPSSKIAGLELEIEMMRLLNQAGADTGEQITVNRTNNGLLRVEGIVDTAGRKSEILDALNSVKNNPAVVIKIQTVDEAVEQQRQQKIKLRAAASQKVEISNNSFAAESELRLYFNKQGKNAEQEIKAFAARMVSRSGRAMSHAGALKRLSNQFSSKEVQKLSPEARAKWLSLIRQHAHAFEQETKTLRQELQPIFSVSSAANTISINNNEDILRAVDRLFKYGSTNDRIIRSAFSVTTNGVAVSAIKSEQFWSSLKSAEAVASAIENAR